MNALATMTRDKPTNAVSTLALFCMHQDGLTPPDTPRSHVTSSPRGFDSTPKGDISAGIWGRSASGLLKERKM